jgi:hypothetical protein
MKRIFMTVFYLLVLASSLYSQYVADSTILLPKHDMQWWRDVKFGLFIHFGLYSIIDRGKWVMWNERIDTSDYSPLDCRYPGFFLS